MPIWVAVFLAVCGGIILPLALRGLGDRIYSAGRISIVFAVIFIVVVWAVAIGVHFGLIPKH